VRRASVVLVGSLLLAACEEHEPPLWSRFERMIDQRRADAYAASPLFPDGMVMRTPPEGTVPREAILGPPVVVTGREDGRYAAAIPVPLEAEDLQRGRQRFEVFCAACHGVTGQGQSPVAEAMSLSLPPSFFSERVRRLPPGRVFATITEGYGLMPSYAAQLSVRERWDVVGFVQALQLTRTLRLGDLPPALQREFRRQMEGLP
jgi:mono/diheme cytochrome c family protein